MAELTQFQKDWIASTLAPESIKSIVVKNIPVHQIVNEDKSRTVYVAEIGDKLYVSLDPNKWKDATECLNFSKAVDIIIPILNLPQQIKV